MNGPKTGAAALSTIFGHPHARMDAAFCLRSQARRDAGMTGREAAMSVEADVAADRAEARRLRDRAKALVAEAREIERGASGMEGLEPGLGAGRGGRGRFGAPRGE